MAIAPGLGFCEYPGCTYDPTTGTYKPITPDAPPTGGAPGTPGTGNRPSAGVGNNSGDLFTKIILGVVGGVIGSELGGSAGAVAGTQTLGGALTQALTGALSGGDTSIVNFLLGQGGPQPGPRGLQPGLDVGDLTSQLAAQPFDVGGLGGGLLTAGPYLGEAGKVAGALLKRKKIKVGQLVTGGSESVLASLLQSVL